MKRTIAAVVLLLAGIVVGCYATTGPVPNCAVNPYQEGCYPPLNDDPPSWYVNGTHAPDAGATDGATPKADR